MNLDTQKQKFTASWEKHISLYGSMPPSDNPDFLYYIELGVPEKNAREIPQELDEKLGHRFLKNAKRVKPQEYHITLALPARRGTHFQTNELSFMKKKLGEIFAKQKALEVQTGNFNVFGNVLYLEVLDPSENLHQLHNEICDTIAFAQVPAYQREHYLPHISLIYGGQWPSVDFRDAFDRTRTSDHLTLGTVRLGRVSDTFGKEVIETYNLGT